MKFLKLKFEASSCNFKKRDSRVEGKILNLNFNLKLKIDDTVPESK